MVAAAVAVSFVAVAALTVVAFAFAVAAVVFVTLAVVALVLVAGSLAVDAPLAPVTFLKNHSHSSIAGHEHMLVVVAVGLSNVTKKRIIN